MSTLRTQPDKAPAGHVAFLLKTECVVVVVCFVLFVVVVVVVVLVDWA